MSWDRKMQERAEFVAYDLHVDVADLGDNFALIVVLEKLLERIERLESFTEPLR